MNENDCNNPAHKFPLRNYPRLVHDIRFWREKAERAEAEVARLKLDKEFSAHKDLQDTYWLQGKVIRQARELDRIQRRKDIMELKDQ